jgi:hypothetical protein
VPESPRRPVGCALLLILLLAASLFGWREYQRQVREHPERFPWTPLALDDPPGPFTAMKLAELRDDPRLCRALMVQVGDADRPAPPLQSTNSQCGFSDGMNLAPEDGGSIRYVPSSLVTACPVAAALRLWEQAVQAAARRHLGTSVATIEHFGSYSCRRLYGRSEGSFSEHATANAVDVAAFGLADGRRISVVNDWKGDADEVAFLRSTRDEACRLFATTLSPDYNEAHRDHLHLDMARRGGTTWTMCR